MRKEQIVVGKTYAVKVSGNICPVRITADKGERVKPNGRSVHAGWAGINEKTRREVYIRGAGRIRYEMIFIDGEWKCTWQSVAKALTYSKTNMNYNILHEDVVMDDCNGGGPDNIAQHSNDNA